MIASKTKKIKTVVLILAAGLMGPPHPWDGPVPRHLMQIAGEYQIRRSLRLIRRFGYDAITVTNAQHIMDVVKNIFIPADDRTIYDTMLSTIEFWSKYDRVIFVQGDQILYEEFLEKVFESPASANWNADHGPPAIVVVREDYKRFEEKLRLQSSLEERMQDCMQNIESCIRDTHYYSEKSMPDLDNMLIWNTWVASNPWVMEKPKPTLLLLGAGQGRRLSLLGDTPKLLLEFGGLTLAEKAIDTFATFGIGEVVVTVGYQNEQVRDHLGTERNEIPIRYVFNPEYKWTEGGSSIAFACELVYGKQVYLMAGDQWFTPELVERLVSSPTLDCVLVDEGGAVTGRDPSLGAVGVRDGLVEKFIFPYPAKMPDNFLGDVPYLIKLSQGGCEILFEFIENLGVSCLNEVAKRLPVRYISTGGLSWVHINTQGGLDYARSVVS